MPSAADMPQGLEIAAFYIDAEKVIRRSFWWLGLLPFAGLGLWLTPLHQNISVPLAVGLLALVCQDMAPILLARMKSPTVKIYKNGLLMQPQRGSEPVFVIWSSYFPVAWLYSEDLWMAIKGMDAVDTAKITALARKTMWDEGNQAYAVSFHYPRGVTNMKLEDFGNLIVQAFIRHLNAVKAGPEYLEGMKPPNFKPLQRPNLPGSYKTTPSK